MNKLLKNIEHVIKAIGYSLQGLKAAWRSEVAFRQEVIVFSILSLIALCLAISALHKVLLIGSLIAVLIVELLNSAIEKAVDHTSLAQSELAKRAKDMASAAVLLSLALAIVVWLVVLIPVVLPNTVPA